jgi:hypothetical protein
VDNSLILQHSSHVALVGRKRGIGVTAIYFNKSRPPRFELETFDSNTMLSYYALTSCTQKLKLKLMGKGGQFTYTSTEPNSCIPTIYFQQFFSGNEVLFS